MNYSRILVVLGQAKSEKTVKKVEYKKAEGREGTHQVSWRWRAPRQREESTWSSQSFPRDQGAGVPEQQ